MLLFHLSNINPFPLERRLLTYSASGGTPLAAVLGCRGTGTSGWSIFHLAMRPMCQRAEPAGKQKGKRKVQIKQHGARLPYRPLGVAMHYRLTSHEAVYKHQVVIDGRDGESVSAPDRTRRKDRDLLRKGQLFRRTCKIRNVRCRDGPLCRGRPEMDSKGPCWVGKKTCKLRVVLDERKPQYSRLNPRNDPARRLGRSARHL
jgi:hypothetical protein